MLRSCRTPSLRAWSTLFLTLLLVLPFAVGCRAPRGDGDAPAPAPKAQVRTTRQALELGADAVAYYPLDGNAADVVGGHDLGLVNAQGFGAALFGQGLAFAGDGTRYAERGADDDAFDFADSDFTVQIWVRFAATAGAQTLIAKYGVDAPGWALEKLADDTLHFDAAPAVTATSAPIGFVPNAWNRIVVRRTGGTLEIFRNGVVVASAEVVDTIPDTGAPLRIGRRDDETANPVNGTVDEVAVFRRALDDAELVSLWNGGAGRRVATDVVLTPGAANVAPRGARNFVASGGVGTSTTFGFALLTNASGGEIDPTTGAYTAGPTPNVVDVILATDAAGNTGTANVNVGPGVTITPAAPVPVAPQGSLQLAAAGGSGAGFAWSIPDNASGGSISAAGLYRAGPTPSVTDTVRVTDSLGNTADVAIPVGAGIAISPAAPSVAPRGSITFLANGGSNAGYVWSFAQNASGGTLTGSVYRAGATGDVTDRVRVTDSLGNVATVDVTVGPALVVSPSAVSTPPNGTVVFGTSGGSGIVASWSLVTNASGGTINAAGEYKAGPTGNVTDRVRATDSLGNTSDAMITVTAPVTISPNVATAPPRGSIAFTATGGSEGGYTWSIPTNSSGASIDESGNYTAGPTGTKVDVVRVTDALGNTRDVNVTVTAGVTITPPNPSAPPLGSVQLVATGGAGSGFSWEIVANNSGGSISATGLFTAGPTGNVADTVQVTDGLGNTASVSVSVGGGLSVNPAAPSTPPRGNVAFTATGGSGMGFAWSFETNASGGTINAATGAYKAGPTPDVTDVVRVVDSLGNARTVSVVVGAGASITPETAVVAPLGTVAFGAAGGSGAGFTYSFGTNASGGTINATTGAYRAGPAGDVTDVVVVTDSLGNTKSASVTVTARLAIAPTITVVAPRGSASFAASGGAGGYTFSLQTNASGGNVSASGGVYTSGAKGSVVDVVRVTDANGATATATINVGPEVKITPSPAHAPPLGTIAFVATGGSGFGYAWELATTASGGTIDPTTGEYTAGETANTVDTVRVTDSLGNVAILGVSVGDGLAITPAITAVAPRATIDFIVTGGSGSDYKWRLEANASGGTIDEATGKYVAGPTGNVVDVVEVVDAVGGKTTARVEVGAGVSITPAEVTTETGKETLFSVAGGSGAGYTWTVEPNVTGAVVGPDGKYVAGKRAGIDTVTVKDSLGNAASASVLVRDPSAPGGVSTSPGGFTTVPPAKPDANACGCRAVGASEVPHDVARLLSIAALAIGAFVRRRRRPSA